VQVCWGWWARDQSMRCSDQLMVTVNGEQVIPQPGGFYGGWITSWVVGPFKGIPGSMAW
jgi:hypothetical protein